VAVPQTQKKVGLGGCLVSILLFVLGVAAFGGLIVWATIGIVNDLKGAPSVPLGTSGQVTIGQTGTQYLFLGDLDTGGTIPATNPVVRITDPAGNDVTVSSPTTSSSGSSSSGAFRSIGQFDATSTGTYTVDTSAGSIASSSGAKIYVSHFDVASIGVKFLLAFGIGGILVVAAVVLAIVWLVRRSRSKSAPPPYQGGYPGYPGYPSGPAGPPGYQQPSYPPTDRTPGS